MTNSGIKNRFYGAYMKHNCISIKENHLLLGTTICQVSSNHADSCPVIRLTRYLPQKMFDGDVNSPTIFVDQAGSSGLQLGY